MSDKKHIDRLFQERLKDFQATPSDAVWQNINSKLQHQEKDKKVIPLWMKVAGIAAGLLLLVAVGNIVLNTNENPTSDTIVDTKSEENKEDINPTDKGFELNSVKDENIASEDKLEDALNDVNLNDSSDNTKKDVAKGGLTNPRNNSNAVSQRKSNSEENKLLQNRRNEVNEAIAENDYKNNDAPNPLLDKEPNRIDKEKVDALVKTKLEDDKSAIVDNLTNEVREENNSVSENDTKVSIAEEILKQEDVAADEVEDEKLDRWSIMPNVAPVYFNSIGSGSAIDPQFNDNARTGALNLSYGIAANYKVNDKLSIRAGLNQVTLGYSTDNVVVFNNIPPAVENPLKNVRLNEIGQSLSFLSADGLNFAQVPSVVADNIKSSISQKFGFIEVPIELEYKLLDKKIGVRVIGGFSSLFLNKNEVSTTLQGEETLLGEATNIKKTSFSANVGLGFDFKISEQINLNLEPVFKYQLNTFSDTSGDFNPYFIGVYTGFSFKF